MDLDEAPAARRDSLHQASFVVNDLQGARSFVTGRSSVRGGDYRWQREGTSPQGSGAMPPRLADLAERADRVGEGTRSPRCGEAVADVISHDDSGAMPKGHYHAGSYYGDDTEAYEQAVNETARHEFLRPVRRRREQRARHRLPIRHRGATRARRPSATRRRGSRRRSSGARGDPDDGDAEPLAPALSAQRRLTGERP